MSITKETLNKARAWFSATPSLRRLQGIELRDNQVESGWSSRRTTILVF